MDSQNLVKSFKYNSPQQPIFSVIESPLHYRSFPSNNPTTFKERSFSSFQPKDPIKNSQENETDSTIDDAEISIFDAQKYFGENNDMKDIIKKPHQQQKQQQRIPSHDLLSVPRLSSVSSADGYGGNYRTRSFHATPTASSEASWNSQTGLLANPPGSVAVSLRNFPSDMRSKKRNPAAKKWSFCRKCCCISKNSVKAKEATSDSDVRGHAHVIHNEMNNMEKTSYSYVKRGQNSNEKAPANMPQKIPIPNVEMALQQKATASNYHLQLSPEEKFAPTDPPRQQRVSASGRPFGDATAAAFSFPILNSSIHATKPAGFKAKITKSVTNPLEDPPRYSLEVFQPVHDPMPISRTPDFNPGSPMARLSNMDDDMYSDASSDLFEIESFSTQSNSYKMYRGRDSLDDEAPEFNPRRFASSNGMISSNNNNLHARRSIDEPPTPSVAATECYAPSEVSIDWSVTTAEGFDRASVTNFCISASEIGNVAFLHKRLQEEASGGDSGKRKGNGLLQMSCRQEKSVSVGPQPVKCAVPEGPPLFPLGISGGAGHVSGRPPRANKLPLGSSHSARLSLAFAA
ncbi:protein PHYTOCHROME KINASE SUBSTRATE 4-like [Primulina tabacum]|uniref:protein PHYTOCHROME KINASE SUBSTRATE 4-like n=1 Tax=Primulina tabacum TaxID=48773 RepID=UPI003F5A5EEA